MVIYQVDAFATKAFGGNPAAVCVTSKPLDESLMQNIAMEMNLSETAFLVEESNAYHLRWFTPSSEVKLCGHATLASAHILWSEGYVNDDVPISFRTLSGVLSAEKIGNQIQLDFPAKEEVEVDMEEATVESLIESLGVSATYVGKNEFDYIVEVASPDEIDALSPNFSLLEQIPVRGGVIVTAKDTSESIYDFVSRFFAPAVGVNEDPVTGSATVVLALIGVRS